MTQSVQTFVRALRSTHDDCLTPGDSLLSLIVSSEQVLTSVHLETHSASECCSIAFHSLLLLGPAGVAVSP